MKSRYKLVHECVSVCVCVFVCLCVCVFVCVKFDLIQLISFISLTHLFINLSHMVSLYFSNERSGR